MVDKALTILLLLLAQLFAAVMQVTELKLSTDNLKKIAEIMGEGTSLTRRSSPATG